MKRILITLLFAGLPVFAQQPEVLTPAAFATTPPLLELVQREASLRNLSVPDIPRLQHEHGIPLPTLPAGSGPDPLLPVPNPPVTSTFKATSALNFLGNGVGFPGFTITGEPPDTSGAVGTTQYVQWVNTSFTIFSKASGAAIAGPTDGNLLWASLPAGSICRTTNSGDILVHFDKLNSRWVLSQFAITADTNGQYAQCVAVSNTPDATGTYNVYQFNFTDFPDFPKMGVWSDAYYITFNMFSHTTGDFLNAKACAFNGAPMRAGTATTVVCFNTPTFDDFSLLPSDIDGSTLPPAGAPNPHWELYDIGVVRLFNFHVDFVTPGNSTFTRTTVPVPGFTFVCNNFTGGTATCIDQPGVTQKLDTLGDRMMYRAAYRNRAGVQSVMLSHSVDATGAPNHFTGVRWYEMRITEAVAGGPYATTIFQQATQAPATNEHRWMPSIAMDKAGNVLLGYSVSNGTSTFPSIRITGRTRTEPRNFMETEFNVVAGTGAQSGHSRWGDYSGMTVDPVDDCTFWYTTEYFDSPNADFAWKTRIASFKFASCQ